MTLLWLWVVVAAVNEARAVNQLNDRAARAGCAVCLLATAS